MSNWNRGSARYLPANLGIQALNGGKAGINHAGKSPGHKRQRGENEEKDHGLTVPGRAEERKSG
jgi:hypothetical protein